MCDYASSPFAGCLPSFLVVAGDFDGSKISRIKVGRKIFPLKRSRSCLHKTADIMPLFYYLVFQIRNQTLYNWGRPLFLKSDPIKKCRTAAKSDFSVED